MSHANDDAPNDGAEPERNPPQEPGPNPKRSDDAGFDEQTTPAELIRQIRGLLTGHVEHGTYVAFCGLMKVIPRIRRLKDTMGGDAFEEAAFDCGVGKNNAHDIVKFLAHRTAEIWQTVEAAASQAASRDQIYEYPTKFGSILKWYKPKNRPKTKPAGDEADAGNRTHDEIKTDLQETTDRLKELQEKVAVAESRATTAAADTDRYRNLYREAQDLTKEAANRELGLLGRIGELSEKLQAAQRQDEQRHTSRRQVEQWWAAVIAELEAITEPAADIDPDEPAPEPAVAERGEPLTEIDMQAFAEEPVVPQPPKPERKRAARKPKAAPLDGENLIVLPLPKRRTKNQAQPAEKGETDAKV